MIVPWTQEWSEPVRTLLRTCLGPKTLQLDEALWRWQYEQNPCANGAVRHSSSQTSSSATSA